MFCRNMLLLTSGLKCIGSELAQTCCKVGGHETQGEGGKERNMIWASGK